MHLMISFMSDDTIGSGQNNRLVGYVLDKYQDPKKTTQICDTFNIAEPCKEAGRILLKQTISSLGMSNAPTTILLPRTSYDFYTVDSLGEGLDTFASLQWRLAGYLPYPVEEAVVDYIELPKKNITQKNGSLYVFAARESALRTWETWAKSCHIRLKHMSIWPILLLSQKIQKAQTMGTLYMMIESDHLEMVILQANQIILIRYVHLPQNVPSLVEIIALEVQRTIDYCASSMGHGNIGQVEWISDRNPEPIKSSLAEVLGLKVQTTHLSALLCAGGGYEANH